ncbi:CCR4-NOT transcription complex subunit [Sesamum angolense]|uniref:CCR4-NOT transcription complex subunit n=2 Tax=Sesamum TaxID=4181 RepID=A0AAE1X2X6_9LAMI|nr:CCR4-NOT transcription complex subunit [Sesamum angolense]
MPQMPLLDIKILSAYTARITFTCLIPHFVQKLNDLLGTKNVKVTDNKQSEELAHASGEQLDVASNNGSKHTASTRGSNAVGHPSSSFVYTDDFDTSVATFNIAVIWYHLHEYAKSFSYLDTLYQSIEPIGEGTALRICLLLLDVALLSDNASRFSDVISYMEKVFCVNSLTNQVDNGTSTQQQSLLASKSASFTSNSTVPDSSYSDSVVTVNSSENSLTRTLSEEALEDESMQLLSSLDISGQNLQRPVIAPNDLPRNQAEESLSAADLRLKLHLYKVRFLLLTRNLKAAKREVKMAMNIARGKDYPMALYLKSQLEYARGNHRKAIKLLMASSISTELGISSMYYNNLGCIYYRLGKHHTSGVFFSKALRNSSVLRKEKPRKLLNLSQDKSLLISYNCGLINSIKCTDKPDIKVNVIGKGKWRQLGLRYGSSPTGQGEYVGKDSSFIADDKQPDLSMSLARQCLVNALYLLDSAEANYTRSGLHPSSEETPPSQSTNHKDTAVGDPKAPNIASSVPSQVNSNGEVKEQKGGNNQSGSLQNSITEYEHIRMKENQMMKQAALADLAYVELALGNPLKALSAAKSLMKLPDSSKIYIFLGTMYAAEALCLLNKPNEAGEYLMMYVSGGNNIELPYSQEDCEKWRVEKVVDGDESNGGTTVPSAVSLADESQGSMFLSPEEARGMFCANYAANFALLGDFERAHHFVIKALSDIPNSSQAILTAIYVDLKRGKTQDALSKLKQHTGVRFLPGSLTLNGSS